MRYALIEKSTEKVVNVIEYDGVSKYDPGEEYYLIRSDECEIDCHYKDGCFIHPDKPKVEPYVDPLADQKMALRKKLKDQFGLSDVEIDLLRLI